MIIASSVAAAGVAGGSLPRVLLLTAAGLTGRNRCGLCVVGMDKPAELEEPPPLRDEGAGVAGPVVQGTVDLPEADPENMVLLTKGRVLQVISLLPEVPVRDLRKGLLLEILLKGLFSRFLTPLERNGLSLFSTDLPRLLQFCNNKKGLLVLLVDELTLKGFLILDVEKALLD